MKYIKKLFAIALAAALLVGCSPGENSTVGDSPAVQPEAPSGSDTASISNIPSEDGKPQVFMTTDISPEGLMAVYKALDWTPTDIADVVILDENGSMSLPVTGGNNLTENLVGEHFADYDSYLVLSHFKGHAMAGFGGAIKNISIGLGSGEGKCWIHSGGTSHTSPWGGD